MFWIIDKVVSKLVKKYLEEENEKLQLVEPHNYRVNAAELLIQTDRVQDSHEVQGFWMTRLYWVGIRLNQFEMFG